MKFNKLFETLSTTEQKVVKFNFENIASFDDIPYRGSIIKLIANGTTGYPVYSCDFSDVFFTKNYPAKIFSSFDIAETYRKSFEEYTRNAIKKAKEGYFTIREIADASGLEMPNFKIIDSIENMNGLFDSADHI